MSKKKKKIDYGEHRELAPEAANAVSATECTGLMPTPPHSSDELESYKDLHSMETPKKLPSRREIKNGVYDSPPPEIRG